MATFTQVLRRLREYKGLTQEELAKQLNITRTRLASYEQGTRQPDLELLEIIADYFNVNMDFLLGRESSASTSDWTHILKLDEDWSEDELKEIESFKEFLKMKRKVY